MVSICKDERMQFECSHDSAGGIALEHTMVDQKLLLAENLPWPNRNKDELCRAP